MQLTHIPEVARAKRLAKSVSVCVVCVRLKIFVCVRLKICVKLKTFIRARLSICNALDALHDIHDIEVDEQSETPVHKFEIGEQLLVMYRLEFLHGLLTRKLF